MNQLSKAAAIMGRKGGQAGTGSAKARSIDVARAAALKRWRDPEGIKQRFWSKVKKGSADECWPWIGSKAGGGYGMVTIARKQHTAHRMAFKFANGRLDPTKDVCHKCDNPPCCNPAHLFEGTESENIRDSVRKGRWALRLGSSNNKAKLNEQTVLEIRKKALSGCGAVNLAKQYGIDRTCVWQIVSRKTWKHI